MNTALKKFKHILEESDLWTMQQAHTRLLDSPSKAPLYDLYQAVVDTEPTFDLLILIKDLPIDRKLLCLTDMCAGALLTLQASKHWLNALIQCQAEWKADTSHKVVDWLTTYIQLTQVRFYIAQGNLSRASDLIESSDTYAKHQTKDAILIAQHALVSVLQGEHERALKYCEQFTQCLLPIRTQSNYARKKIRKSYSAIKKENKKSTVWSLEPEGLFVVLFYHAWQPAKETERLFRKVQEYLDPYLLGCAPLNEIIYTQEQSHKHSTSQFDANSHDLFDLFAPVGNESSSQTSHLIGSWDDLGHPLNVLWVAWSVRIHQMPLDDKQRNALHKYYTLAQQNGYVWFSEQCKALLEDEVSQFDLETKIKGRSRGITWGKQKWNVFNPVNDIITYEWQEEQDDAEAQIEEISPFDTQFARRAIKNLEDQTHNLPSKVKKAQKLKKEVSAQMRVVWVLHTKTQNSRKKNMTKSLENTVYSWSDLQLTARLQLKRKRTWTQGRKLKLSEILVQKNVPVWIHAIDYQIAETIQKIELEFNEGLHTELLLELFNLLQQHKYLYWFKYQKNKLRLSYQSQHAYLSLDQDLSVSKVVMDIPSSLLLQKNPLTHVTHTHQCPLFYVQSQFHRDHLSIYTAHQNTSQLNQLSLTPSATKPSSIHSDWQTVLETALVLEFDQPLDINTVPSSIQHTPLPIHLVALCEAKEVHHHTNLNTPIFSLTFALWVDESYQLPYTHECLVHHSSTLLKNLTQVGKVHEEYRSIRGKAIPIAQGSPSTILRSFIGKFEYDKQKTQDFHLIRNLQKEAHSFSQALQKLSAVQQVLPADVDSLHNSTHQPLLLTLYQALSILHDLQSNDSDFHIVWNHDSPKHILSVSQNIDVEQLSIETQVKEQQLILQANLTDVTTDQSYLVNLSLDQIQQQLIQKQESLFDMSTPFLSLGDGKFLTLTQQLRAHLEQLGRFQHSVTEDLNQEDPYLQILLTDLYQENMQSPSADHWKQIWNTLHPKKDIQISEHQVHPELNATLRGYQQQGLTWLSHRTQEGVGCCLADDMGLGKTLQALALLLERSELGPTLIVAPTSLCGVWEKEARKFAPSLSLIRFAESERNEVIEGIKEQQASTTKTQKHWPLLVCSYGLLSMSIDLLKQVHWHTLIFDEAQALKNSTTKRYQAAQQLQTEATIAITGTPIENHLKDIWSLFNLLNPGLLGSRKRFHEKWNVPIEAGDTQAMQHLHLLLKPFILRRNKQDVLNELPPRTNISVPIELDVEERAHYEALRLGSIQKAQQGQHQSIHILAQLTQLRRACCHPKLVSPELDIPSAKMIAFRRLITDLKAGGHRVLVFSQFVDYLKLIRSWLNQGDWSYQYLDGSTSSRMRDKAVQSFQNGEGDLFLISLKAGGFGLTLTQADFVIHMDPWWNPAVEDQASDRAHRIGQTRPVTVYRLVTMGTIEEKVMGLHASKRHLAQQLLSNQVEKSLSAQDLMNLLTD